jgi:hypothetical protein
MSSSDPLAPQRRDLLHRTIRGLAQAPAPLTSGQQRAVLDLLAAVADALDRAEADAFALRRERNALAVQVGTLAGLRPQAAAGG